MKTCRRLGPELRASRFVALVLGIGALAAGVHAQDAAPTLEQRLANLCEDVDLRREELHIPGLSLAVVQDGKLILARGFGQRDVEKKIPADEHTRYGIGSTSKAFTAMLVTTFVDEGKMSYDDSPKKYLPWFKFRDPVADTQATLRDLMSHRTGLTRTDVAWYGTGASREDLLRQIAEAVSLHPFRDTWQYNNTMFLCAGECAAAVGGKNWDDLLRERIFTPLRMQQTSTRGADALADPQLSHGYAWNEGKKGYDLLPFRDIDNMGPAGSITSTVVDMSHWVRFLLDRGVFEGKRLVREEHFANDLWKHNPTKVPGINYGLGWMLHGGDEQVASKEMDEDGAAWRSPDGKKHLVVEHGGNIDGYAAEVGLLPDRHVGFVMLSNVSASQLQGDILNVVFNAICGDVRPRPKVADGTPLADEKTAPMLGAYRQPNIVAAALPPCQLAKVGDHLTLVMPPRLGQVAAAVYTLLWPDAEQRWFLKQEPTTYAHFERDSNGGVSSFTLVSPDRSLEYRHEAAKSEPPPPDVSIDELMARRAETCGCAAADGMKSLRLTGTVRYVHGGVSGTVVVVASGPDKLRIDYDAGKFGHAHVVVNGSRGVVDSHTGGRMALDAAGIGTLLLSSPLVEAGSWLDHAKDVEVVRQTAQMAVGAVLPRMCLAVRVTPYEGQPMTYYLGKEDLALCAVEGSGAYFGIPMNFPFAQCSDYRDVGGLKIPFRREAQAPEAGQLVVQIDKAEVDPALPADTFEVAAATKATSGS